MIIVFKIIRILPISLSQIGASNTAYPIDLSLINKKVLGSFYFSYEGGIATPLEKSRPQKAPVVNEKWLGSRRSINIRPRQTAMLVDRFLGSVATLRCCSSL